MWHEHYSDRLPRYTGLNGSGAGLPGHSEPWLAGGDFSVDPDCGQHHSMAAVLRRATRYAPWKWPGRQVFFIADPHADADAFIASMVACGGVKRTGPGPEGFKLTSIGRKGIFVIGGDCLDKGPSNLQLLRAIRRLMKCRARVKLLAGNHDMRLLLALRSLDERDNVLTQHLFVRMGDKGIPLLREVYDEYLKGSSPALRDLPDEDECRRRLFPSEAWFEQFPRQASRLMTPAALHKEVQRMRRKTATFEAACARRGLSLRQVYAAASLCRKLFLKPKGEFAWFYAEMRLAYRAGSFLFLHAGLDDFVTGVLEEKGVAHLNRLYRKQVKSELFDFYYGPLANTMRTKYRDVDYSLSEAGVERFYRQGLHAVVHGHRNNHFGQRIMLRRGILHIESDTTLDRNSRSMEGLSGVGAGVTVIQPEGRVLGISVDYPCAKIFEPLAYLRKRRPLGLEVATPELVSQVAAGY